MTAARVLLADSSAPVANALRGKPGARHTLVLARGDERLSVVAPVVRFP